MLNGLDLFSGIGGISIALEPWVRTVAYCEQDRYAQSVLLSRQSEGVLHRAPIWDDVQTLTGDMLPAVDIIFGGFPCQDISVAGNGAGLEGKRSGLYWELFRLVKETKPQFVFLENVAAIRTSGLNRVVSSFTSIGYDCRWTIVSAREVGAPHARKRWFFLASNSNGKALWEQQGWCEGARWEGKIQPSIYVENGSNPNTDSQSKGIRQPSKWNQDSESLWTLESDNWDDNAQFFLRVDNGVRDRPHQVKCLGNSVVPAQARKAFKILLGIGSYRMTWTYWPWGKND